MKKIIFAIVLLVVVSACSSSVYTEKDKVTNTQFVKLKIDLSGGSFFLPRGSRNEPYYRQELTIVKEISKNNLVSYKLYDVITMPDKSFELDSKKMYIIVDNDIYPLENDYEKRYNDQQINENKKEVMQSDSTKVSVVSGYNVVNEKVYQMIHPVSPEIMEQISDAKEVILRYTAGPDFINSKIKGRDLNNLKRLINK